MLGAGGAKATALHTKIINFYPVAAPQHVANPEGPVDFGRVKLLESRLLLDFIRNDISRNHLLSP